MVDCHHLEVTDVTVIVDNVERTARMCETCYSIWTPVRLSHLGRVEVVSCEAETFFRF